ncbi:MAG: magnesium transporter, partial [Rhodospirillales bacterium]|nr:magnesium transporter [Rhodospirillales bacterium]
MAHPDPPPEAGAAPEPGGREGLYGLTTELVGAVRAALTDSDGDRVRALVAPLHEADIADLIERFSAVERRRLIAIAHDVLSGDVLPHVEDDIREELIGEIGAERAAEAIADMESDDAVAVLEDLDDPQRKEILDAISSEERAGVAESLTYPEDSAGRLMQRELVALPAFWTVGQTIDHMRE